jgi:hypothetical protein
VYSGEHVIRLVVRELEIEASLKVCGFGWVRCVKLEGWIRLVCWVSDYHNVQVRRNLTYSFTTQGIIPHAA